ncbi:hypothetical protein CEQ90_10180 [Lewinellaceae bacterium SD302]|nr:hypothetical protein CEQ90_10180 [Lewinellaceae bacterium SD302]
MRQIEDYLIYEKFRTDDFQSRNISLRLYNERGLFRHLTTRISRYQRRYPTAAPTASLARYQHDHRLEKERYHLMALSKRNDRHNLSEQETSIFHHMLAMRFRQACETLAHLRLTNKQIDLPLLDECLAAYAQNPKPEQPGIHLFYLATLLYLRQDNDPVFADLKSGIEAYIDDFPHNDQRDLLVLAINHCLRQSNAGRREFLSQTLDLYKLGLQRKTFYERGRIGIFTFNNIVGVALKLGEVGWADEFLEANASRLPQEKREEVVSLNRARLAYEKSDYDATLSFLQTADYQDFIHHFTARLLQLKIFFERDDFNLLTSHLRSTKSLLGRRKNIGYHQRNYRNIFRLAEKIVRIPPGDREVAGQLKAQIMATDPCTEKEWLLRAVERDF